MLVMKTNTSPIRRLYSLVVLLAPAVLLAAAPALAETPFEVEYLIGDPRPQGHGAEAGEGLLLAPPSPVNASDRHLFVYINGLRDNPSVSQTSCTAGVINDKADCFSATVWLERSIGGLLSLTAFQDRLQTLINELLDDPATAWPDPLLDQALALPLVGRLNLGLYIQDLWNPASCWGTPPLSSSNPAAGPRFIVNNAWRIGCKYLDNDTLAIDLKGDILQPGNYTVKVEPQGAQDGNSELASGLDHEGAFKVTIALTQPLDADLIFRQPDFPTQITEGYYLHAAGKVRLKGLQIELSVYTIGGNLRGLMSGAPSGYSVGVDFERLYLSGGLVLDIDGFVCQDITSSDIRVYNNTPACDVDDMLATHPDRAAGGTPAQQQTRFQDATNERGKLIAELIKYIEAHLTYEAVRATGPVATYLTALEALDLQSLTHEITGGTIYEPTIENPLSGQNLYFDYGVFWRFNGERGTQPWHNYGADLVGGYGLQVTYPGGSSCTGAWNPTPFGPRIPTLGEAPMYFRQTRNARDALVGVGFHATPINRALDQIWEQKVLCADIWSGNPGPFGDAVTSVLNTDFFRTFLPSLDRNFDGRQMMIRIVPRYVSPGDPVGTYTIAGDQPQIILNPGDPSNLIPGTNWVEDPARYPGPFDARLKLPHLELQFLVDVSPTGDGLYTSFVPMFSVDVGLDVYVGLGWYKITSTYWPNTPTPPNTTCSLSPYPCRVARVNAFVDLKLNKITEYDTVTALDPDGLQHALSSLVAMLLDGVLQGKLELALNTSSPDFLGFVLDPGYPSSGAPAENTPAFLGTGVEPLDLHPNANYGNTDGIYEYLGLYLTVGDVYGSYNPDGTVNPGPDGKSDTLSPVWLMDMLEEAGVFDLLGAPKTRPERPLPTAPIDPHPSPETFLDLPSLGLYGRDLQLSVAEVALLGLGRDPNVRIGVAAMTANGPDAPRYQYRIDGGMFRLADQRGIALPAMFDGAHALEVWAIDHDGYIDAEPAVLKFTLDRTAPKIAALEGQARLGVDGELNLPLRVSDRVSAADALSVEWRLDGGAWTAIAADGTIAHRVEPGRHRLEVRATDEAGNVEVRTWTFVGEESAWGCRGGSAGSGDLVLLTLALGAPLLLRRWRTVHAAQEV